jgi:hypothetical protein
MELTRSLTSRQPFHIVNGYGGGVARVLPAHTARPSFSSRSIRRALGLFCNRVIDPLRVLRSFQTRSTALAKGKVRDLASRASPASRAGCTWLLNRKLHQTSRKFAQCHPTSMFVTDVFGLVARSDQSIASGPCTVLPGVPPASETRYGAAIVTTSRMWRSSIFVPIVKFRNGDDRESMVCARMSQGRTVLAIALSCPENDVIFEM